jgi:lysophospholipase L1-like esterase
MRLCPMVLLVLVSTAAMASPKRAWVAVGDSITYGYAHDATPYPKRLATLLGENVVNMGVGGEVAATINTRATTHALAYPFKGVIIEECINDLIAGTAGATCWTATEAVADSFRSAGFLVVLVTAIPCGNYASWSGAKETQRDAYNALLRAYVAAHPADTFLVDLDTAVSDDGNTIRAADDYGDGLHLNGTGMQNLAQSAADAI